MSLSLTTALVLSASGEIDEQASTRAFQDALANYKAERELESDTISEQVHAIFDQYPGASIQMPALINMTLRSLNVQPANYSTMFEKVGAFVRANSDRPATVDKKTKAVLVPAEPARTRSFGIKKGVGGGVCRWSDVPEKSE